MTGSKLARATAAAALLLLFLRLSADGGAAAGARPLTTEERRLVGARARTLAGLAAMLRERVDLASKRSDQVDLVFVIDASASVGEANFRGELNFVRKLLSDLTMAPRATRVAIVTFASKDQIIRQVDYVSLTRQRNLADDKCRLLNIQLDAIGYSGGGTYTHGALMEAFAILENSRPNTEKIVFLVTDGFSNGEDPRYAANLLKGLGVTIFTFGIQTGNVDELRDIASEPSYAYSYFLNSFLEFEALARKALHRDLRVGVYAPAGDPRDCELLCTATTTGAGNKVNQSTLRSSAGAVSTPGCCDPIASCTCGTASGHYACICPVGYFGSGLAGSCQPCRNGSYGAHNRPNDLSVACVACPDPNHVTMKVPALSLKDCICAPGYTDKRGFCAVVTCPKLIVPENGYFVKPNACNNVLNAACGIRCRIGFHLVGDSIRLCNNSGSWSGAETQCLLKTCPALVAPTNGRIRCEYDDEYSRSKVSDKDAQPIDTRCQFKCDNGYQVRGSKVRNCLPLSRWDGLKTSCKPTYCEPIKPVLNAEILPKTCLGPKKLPFTSNCTISCLKGYKLEGPRHRSCVGRQGTWSKRHSVNRCIDKTRPVLNCPPNITVRTRPHKNYTYVSWTVPNATDNSEDKCNVWSKPHVTFPWKVHIGKHTVKYIAQDVSGNRARCSFNVYVVDKESPKFENCENNQLFTNGSEKHLKDFMWDEPIFYDNSGFPLKINETIHSATEDLIEGHHTVSYLAMDKYENIARCLINITIRDSCNKIPKPLNGRAHCTNIKKSGKQCRLFCDHGYAFAFNTPVYEISKNRIVQIVTCDPKSHQWNVEHFPECTLTKNPSSISHETSVILEGDSVNCDNATMFDNLTKHINESYNFNVISLCTDNIKCDIKSEVNCKHRVTRGLDYNVQRKKRNSQRIGGTKAEKLENLPKQEQIEIKFTFVAKIIEEYENNTQLGITKLKEKIQSMAKSGELNLLDNETNSQIGKLALNLNMMFNEPREICETGSILKKNTCVKCPAGTFHNVIKGICEFCALGEYQSDVGSTACEKCPNNFSTRKTHTRSSADCLPACQPGHYSRRRHHPDLTASLVPCISCEIGFYQPQYGQSQCLPCPRNTITEGRAATSMSACLPVNRTQIDTCRPNPCLNRGTCTKENDGYSCECRDHYVGSQCEIFVNPCLSSPCSSYGQCILKNNSDNQWTFFCLCNPGYTGTYCETLINECSYSPCRNGGTCLSTDTDITCTCRDGFEGDFCEVAVNHCSPSLCEMNSTCHSVNGTWRCLCRPGYLGLRCNLLPCDWLPCHPNEICSNVLNENPDKSDYRCECPLGFKGTDCLTKIDHCENHSCRNNGTCINHLLNYTCNCQVPFTGSKCEFELLSDYVMHFSRSGTTDYVIMPGPAKNLSQLTVCFWLQSIDTFNYGTVVSYATPNQDNVLTITDYNGFVLYVNGEKVITDDRMNDGYWHFVCVSWENKLGSWQYYVDGDLKDNGTSLAKDTEIEGSGTFIFGQEQDKLGGGFSESESFLGKLHLLDIWDVTHGPDYIYKLSKTCEKYYGSIVAWAQLQEHIRGSIELENSTFCQGCPPPVAPYKGNVNLTADGSEVIYSCDTGYEFRKQFETFKTLRKTCLKHGHWEGLEVSNCVRVTCVFPGYFLRGWVQGQSYMYGDKIFYHCNEGYDLKGNSQRICKADGKWSGVTPFCMGVTCKNLLAPDHGDIEYIIEEHDRDDLSILQVGQQLEFKCEPGYFLQGQKILTCLENGTWNFKRPECILMGCPAPKQVSHGRIVTNVSVDLSEVGDDGAPLEIAKLRNSSDQPLYFYGDVVGFSCEPGYKFEGNHNLLAEFKLQCTSGGVWKGLVPDCVPLQCPSPEAPENARLYLLQTGQNETASEILLDDIASNLNSSGNESESFHESEVNGVEDNFSRSFVPGAQIKIICQDGFISTTDLNIKNCTENEIWDGEDVYCELLHCPVDNHPIIGIFVNNYTAKSAIETQDSAFDEAAGVEYHASSSNNTTDLTKRLIKMFDFFFEGDSYGDKVILQCRNKDSFYEESLNYENLQFSWKCGSEGSWQFLNENLNETEIIEKILNGKNLCSKTCGPPKAPENGFVKYESDTNNFENESVTFECNQGYTLVGIEKSYCLANRTWSSIPKCQPAICEKPSRVSYAEFKNENLKIDQLVVGSTLSYQCIPGYRITGQLNARCLASGKWSKVNGRCTRISCGKPQLAAGASIQGNSYLYQDRLIYICPGEKFRDFIVCNQDGKWTTLPKCT